MGTKTKKYLIIGVSAIVCSSIALSLVFLLGRHHKNSVSKTADSNAGKVGGKTFSTEHRSSGDAKSALVDLHAGSEVVSGKGPPKSSGAVSCPSWIVPSSVADITKNIVDRARTMGKVNVAFLGDSITALLDTYPSLPNYAKSLGSKGKYAVLAVPGDTIGSLLWRLCQPNAFPSQVDVYVICIGTNDLSVGTADVIARLQYLRDFIRSRNSTAHILFLSLFWRGDMPGILTRVDAVNSQLRQLVESSDSKIHYTDWPRTLTSQPDFIDLLHPFEGGWIKVFDKLFPYLNLLLNG